MKATLAELNTLKGSWERLMQARPGEMQFSSFGFNDLNGEVVSGALNALIAIVEGHVKKTRSADREDIALADGAAVRTLRELRGWVDAAHGNGVSWLLASTDFLFKFGMVSSILRQSITRNIDLRARIARLAADDVHNDLTVVQSAAGIARDIIKKESEILDAEKSAISAKGEIDVAHQEVTTSLEAARLLSEEFKKTKDDIFETVESIKTAKALVDTSKASAESDSKKLQESLTELTTSIESAIDKSNDANKQLDAALRDARRQGLAKAFSDRHRAASREYYIWIGVFGVSLVLLSALAAFQLWWVHENNVALSLAAAVPSVPVATATTPAADGLLQILRRLLSELPFAIPVVWLGWYSAKRIGIVSRLAQDYEYKAATALAFESYKNEAQLLGGGDLSQQLLSTTIKNFGDNPVRLTEHNDKDLGHPLESLVTALKDEKSYDRLLKLIEKLKGS